MKKLLSLILAVVSVFCISAFAEDGVPAAASVSDTIIADSTYKPDEQITREKFCELVYNMTNSVKELPMAKLAKNPFDDVMNYKINGLSFVGIVSGKSEGVFAPNDLLTREEEAVILCRAAEYAGAELPEVKVDAEYADNAEISPWAVSFVYKLKVLNVFDDTETGFKPAKTVTEKEAVTALEKLYDIIKK